MLAYVPDNPKQKVRAHEYPQDLFHSTHYLDQLVFLWFRSEQHKWNMEHRAHPCLHIWYTHHPTPPPPTNFKNKNFAPFSWSGSLTMGGELRLLEGLNPLSPPSNLYRLQCLWSLCSLTFSWEHADCWTSHLEWCWSYCWRNSYKKKKKIPFLRNASLKYSCNP